MERLFNISSLGSKDLRYALATGVTKRDSNLIIGFLKKNYHVNPNSKTSEKLTMFWLNPVKLIQKELLLPSNRDSFLLSSDI